MKNIKFVNSFFVVVFLIATLQSCEKMEGEGGKSSITGKVYNKDYNINYSTIIDEYYMADVDVYIVYGDDPSYGDKVKTSYDGTFIFEYLRDGDYTIYVYSDDTTKNSTAKNIPISIDVTIGKKEAKTIDNILIASAVDYDEGHASISGKVYKINYNSDYTIINEEYYSPDEDVYIVYGNDLTYFEKTKTLADGSYSFENLIKGSYKIFVYSEDPSQISVSNIIEISKDTVITSNNQNIVFGDLIISD